METLHSRLITKAHPENVSQVLHICVSVSFFVVFFSLPGCGWWYSRGKASVWAESHITNSRCRHQPQSTECHHHHGSQWPALWPLLLLPVRTERNRRWQISELPFLSSDFLTYNHSIWWWTGTTRVTVELHSMILWQIYCNILSYST